MAIKIDETFSLDEGEFLKSMKIGDSLTIHLKVKDLKGLKEKIVAYFEEKGYKKSDTPVADVNTDFIRLKKGDDYLIMGDMEIQVPIYDSITDRERVVAVKYTCSLEDEVKKFYSPKDLR